MSKSKPRKSLSGNPLRRAQQLADAQAEQGMLLGKSLREAHGFTPEDDSYALRPPLCRNGCGLDYFTIGVGSIERCAAAERKLTSG